MDSCYDDDGRQGMLFTAAHDSLNEVLCSLEEALVTSNGLPWSCQSVAYMQLASATYAPMTGGGDFFAAYCAYYGVLSERLKPWLECGDTSVALNSIMVIARHEVDALERRISDPSLEFTVASREKLRQYNVLKIADIVPVCPVCGHLMEEDADGVQRCPICSDNDTKKGPRF